MCKEVATRKKRFNKQEIGLVRQLVLLKSMQQAIRELRESLPESATELACEICKLEKFANSIVVEDIYNLHLKE